MDPNECLRRIRESLKSYLAEVDCRPPTDEDNDSYTYHADDLAEHVQALDEWMSKGGFAPDAWRATRPSWRDYWDVVLGAHETVESVRAQLPGCNETSLDAVLFWLRGVERGVLGIEAKLVQPLVETRERVALEIVRRWGA